jgi:hypothetical protein
MENTANHDLARFQAVDDDMFSVHELPSLAEKGPPHSGLITYQNENRVELIEVFLGLELAKVQICVFVD